MQSGRKTIIAVVLEASLLFGVGCSQKLPLPDPSDNSKGPRLPFRASSDNSTVTPTALLMEEAVPAGTLIVVHLLQPLSSASARAGDLFEAVLDEPLLVAGRPAIPRGSLLKGKVIASKGPQSAGEPGYLRLTLTAISLGGKSLDLKVSSVLRKGSPGGMGQAKASTLAQAECPAQKRLTFRLAQTLSISS